MDKIEFAQQTLKRKYVFKKEIYLKVNLIVILLPGQKTTYKERGELPKKKQKRQQPTKQIKTNNKKQAICIL